MKHIYLRFFFLCLLSLVGAKASAHDIEVKNAAGFTIYYKWINNKTELEVTYSSSSYDYYKDRYTGNIVIPGYVKYNSKTYTVRSIGDDAFRGCSGLTSVNIPNTVTSIGSSAFSGCSGLTSVTIPNSVTSIGEYAFASCEKLTTVNAMMTNPPVIANNVFGDDDNIYQKAALYVPVGCKDIYSNTEGWKNFVNIEEKDFNATTTVKEDVNGDGKVNALDIQQVINVAAASE